MIHWFRDGLWDDRSHAAHADLPRARRQLHQHRPDRLRPRLRPQPKTIRCSSTPWPPRTAANVVVETASTRGARPKVRAVLDSLKPGDTLVIYKPDRIARSMKELLVLLEDELHARQVNLEILTGICAGTHKPNGQSIADKMLFMVAAMAAEMERDLIHERTMDGLAAAAAQGRFGGRPAKVDDDTLAIARARRSRGESVTAIAAHLGIGRSTLYRALADATTHA